LSEVAVLIDARNVLRSQWPNIPERVLVERCCAWAAASRRRAIVVFDGEAPGGLVGERALEPTCALVGSGAESADEWLERAAADLASGGQRYWLVTSDRALRAAAGGSAEKTVGGGSFARMLAGH
jgi:predicted RNA-binding protein with PIN domain